jgi:spore cortex biosynthesis protein YabQ
VGGIIIGFIYDLFRIKRKAFRTGKIAIFIEDVAYWIIVTFVMFFVIYRSNDGELRVYVFIGAILGVLLYALLFSKAVVNSALFILRIVYKIAKFIWKVVSYPFKVLFKVLSVPARMIKKSAGRAYRKSVHIARNRKSKASMWKKIFKSRRKKL